MKVVPPRATCVWDGMGLGGSISLHFPDGWEQHPSVKEVVAGKIINFIPIPCTCTPVQCTVYIYRYICISLNLYIIQCTAKTQIDFDFVAGTK